MSTVSGSTYGKSGIASLDNINNLMQYIRANRAQYTNVSLQGIMDEDVTDVALPSIQGTAEEEGECITIMLMIDIHGLVQTALEAIQSLTLEEPPDAFSTPSQLGGDLITLTLLPRSRWQTLLNLEVIQVRMIHTPSIPLHTTDE